VAININNTTKKEQWEWIQKNMSGLAQWLLDARDAGLKVSLASIEDIEPEAEVIKQPYRGKNR
jgi:hypothetical protein